jgi:hypothetical protein
MYEIPAWGVFVCDIIIGALEYQTSRSPFFINLEKQMPRQVRAFAFTGAGSVFTQPAYFAYFNTAFAVANAASALRLFLNQ